MSAYRAFVADRAEGRISSEITIRNVRNLPSGDLLIKVKYSSLNYFDVLSVSGNDILGASYPLTPGMDAAGVVVESASGSFRSGDEVLVSGYGLGVTVPGGFGEYIRVPAEWAVSLPTGLTFKDAMTVGSDGLAAALAVMEIMSASAPSEGDSVAVSGASSGTGAFAVSIFDRCGYKVTAVSGGEGSREFLSSLGAYEFISTDKFLSAPASALLPEKYSAAVDCMGGDAVSVLTRSLKSGGSIALCGVVTSDRADLSLYPFILRGINILGIDSVNCPVELKKKAWYKIAGEWKPKALAWLCTEVALSELPGYILKFGRDELKGRVVVNHEL